MDRGHIAMVEVPQPPDAWTFASTGWRYGSRAGCLSSFLMAALILGPGSIRGIIGNASDDWSIYPFMAVCAGILGVLPAVIVGGVVGAIIGVAFHRLGDRLQTLRQARLAGGLVGLVVILPAVLAWLDYLFSSPGTVIRVRNRPLTPLDLLLEATLTGGYTLILVTLCVVPGVYVGGRLWHLLDQRHVERGSGSDEDNGFSQ